MKNAMIYHWWTETCLRAKEDLFNPIIHSIATVRNYNTEVAIYVISLSCVDWGNYPEILKFKVINKKPLFEENLGYQNKLMSRVFDIVDVSERIDEEEILFCDSDVFWLEDPFPLMNKNDLFNCNKNNGIFYYNKNREKAMTFIREWQSDVENTVKDANFRSRLLEKMQFSQTFKVHDELIVRYTQSRLPEMCVPVPLRENNIIFTPICNPKNLHVIRAFVGKKDRLRIAMSIKEIGSAIENVLGPIRGYDGKYSIREITTKKAVYDLCSEGNSQRALDYCLSKIC